MNSQDFACATAKPHYRCLDAWRGLACLMVVAFHAVNEERALSEGSPNGVGVFLLKIVSTMWVGVPIFFVISGYCIASASDTAILKNRGMIDFFWRRFRRIFPTYWSALALAIALTWAASLAGRPELLHDGFHPVPYPSSLTWANWLGNLTLTETWRIHLFGGEYRMMIAQAWTLCYEEQFYLICGLIVALAPRRFFMGIAAVSLFVAVNVLLSRVFHVYSGLSGLFLDGHWLIFAAGVAVYHSIHHSSTRAAYLLAIGFAAIAVGGILGKREFFRHLGSEIGIEIIVCCLMGALLILLRSFDTRLSQLRLFRPFSWCGVRSYSIYLVHWPVSKALSMWLWQAGIQGPWLTLLVTIPLAIVASVLLAWAFFWLVERRFQNRAESGFALESATEGISRIPRFGSADLTRVGS